MCMVRHAARLWLGGSKVFSATGVTCTDLIWGWQMVHWTWQAVTHRRSFVLLTMPQVPFNSALFDAKMANKRNYELIYDLLVRHLSEM